MFIYKIKRTFYYFISILFFITLCVDGHSSEINYSKLSTFTKSNDIRMVVEIPSGTNKKIEYNQDINIFEIDKINGENRIINFLSYLGNYGFVPSTLMKKEFGGDGDPLDILLISESLKTGTVIDVIPIALLVLEDNYENDVKIIAIPANKNLQIVKVKSYEDLRNDYPELLQIIQLWFLNYKADNITKFIKWDDEVAAKKTIYKWRVK